MKKSLSITLLLSLAVLAYGQKGSVSKAKSYRAKGDLISAKGEIDVAITIEKAAAKSATWFERAQIYRDIAISEDEAVKGIDKSALQKSTDAYKKVISMEKENSVSAVFASEGIDNLSNIHLNKAVEFNNAQDYKSSYYYFAEALIVKPEDSLTLYYAGKMAQQAELYDKTLVHYYKMDQLNFANVDVYSLLIYIERFINKDEEKALEVIRTAKSKYPDESSYSQDEIALLISLNKLEEAKTQILEEIKKDPENVSLYLNYAIMHDNLGTTNLEKGNTEEGNKNLEIAKENYAKAVEIDSENYVGNFNLGAIYVNSAKVYFDEVRNMDLNTYGKKGPALETKANGILKQALPYMKKATEIKTDDIGSLRALQQIYTQLKMYDEAEVVMNKLDAMEGEE